MKFKSYVTREVMIEYQNREFRCQRKSHYPFMHKQFILKKINETTVYHCSNIGYYSAIRAYTAYIEVYILCSYLMCSWAIHLAMNGILLLLPVGYNISPLKRVKFKILTTSHQASG